jgi:hypothetical protein
VSPPKIVQPAEVRWSEFGGNDQRAGH